MKFNKELTVTELEDRLKTIDNSIKKSKRALGAEKVICYLLKHSDLSNVPDYRQIRQSVLDTYEDDKQPDFQEDLQGKSEKKVRSLKDRIDNLKKDYIVFEDKLRQIQTNLDDFNKEATE